MARKTAKVTTTKSKTTAKTGNASTGRGRSAGKQKAAAASAEKHNDTSHTYVEQIEEMLNKGMDLTEAGVGLGVNVVTRLSSIFKTQVVDKLINEQTLGAISTLASQPAAPQPHPAEMPPEPGHEASQQDTVQQDANFLMNRLGAHPGGPVSISFSINNDSMAEKKQIKLSIEDFRGQGQQIPIPANAFSVTPSRKSIAPMDFEKFVFKGAIPADAPNDTYHGGIVVSDDEQYRIPVVLVVTESND